VYVIFALDTFQSVVAGFMGWEFLCAGWGHNSALTVPGWTFASIPMLSALGMYTYTKHEPLTLLTTLPVAAWVQLFYAR
jgi:hypothetical protein